MAEATAQAQTSPADEEQKYFRRLWPRPPRSRRLVVLSILGGSLLTVFGILAFWQITHVFSLIDEQRRHQANVNETLRIMSEIDILLRENNTAAIEAVHTLDIAPATDVSTIYAKQAQSRREVEGMLTRLDRVLNLIGNPDYTPFHREITDLVQEMIGGREQMVRNFQLDHDYQKYINLRDRLQVRRTTIADSMLELRSLMEPDLDASQQAVDQELNRAFLLSCVSLAISGTFILMLGWMLVSYVDKRDQVEAHLRRVTDMWIAIINALKQGVAVFDYDQRLLLWNPRYAELQGIDPAKLHVGLDAAEIRRLSIRRDRPASETYAGPFERNIERVRRGESFEREITRVDGVRLQLNFRPMADNYLLVTQTDVTQVRQAERLARDRAVRLGTIMDNVPDAIVVVNASGSIESWNAGAERIFGYEESEIIHRNLSVLMAGPDAARHHYFDQEDTATPNRVWELTARRRDGTEFPIELRVSEMELGDKRMFTAVIRDITERRAVEQMKNEFISTVSHELRTPLTSIIGSLTLLVDGVAGELPDKARRLVAMAEKNSQRLGRLINDILDLEKAESGRMSLRLELIQLLPAVQHSLELNQSYAAQFNVTLRLQADAESIAVRADEVRVLQIMSNLLSNAIKQSPAHSEVLVEVASSNARVRVTVHDAGPGISEEFRPRVFQRFAQADNSHSRRMTGTGLGLAITKQLVEQHNGLIGFDSGQSKVGSGSGASFWFELPVIAHPARPEMDEPLNMSIVLCEDDPDIAALLLEMLHAEGCSVRHTGASNGVRTLLDNPASVLLVDIDLPDENGLALVAELRRHERWRNLPVLVVSGRRPGRDQQAAQSELRICAWLSKPVDRIALRSALIEAKSSTKDWA